MELVVDMQVLPVMLEALPLKEDFEEAEPVYACLVGLLSDLGSRPRIQACQHRILAALEEVQGQPEVPQQVDLDSPLKCCLACI